MEAVKLIEDVLAAASTNINLPVTIKAIIHKLGGIRQNKRELLALDETGIITIKEWSDGNGKYSNISEKQVHTIQIVPKIYNGEPYGQLKTLLSSEKGPREAELENWYTNYENVISKSLQLKNLGTINLGRHPYLTATGCLYVSSEDRTKPDSIIIADNSGKCQVSVWVTIPDTAVNGKKIILKNFKVSVYKHNIQLTIDELSEFCIEKNEINEQWYNTGKFKTVPQVTDQTSGQTFGNPNHIVYQQNTSQTSCTQQQTTVPTLKTGNQQDNSFINSLKETFIHDIKNNKKSPLKNKILDVFANTTLQEQSIEPLFAFIGQHYSDITNKEEKKTVKRKLFDIIEDAQDEKEGADDTMDESPSTADKKKNN